MKHFNIKNTSAAQSGLLGEDLFSTSLQTPSGPTAERDHHPVYRSIFRAALIGYRCTVCKDKSLYGHIKGRQTGVPNFF